MTMGAALAGIHASSVGLGATAAVATALAAMALARTRSQERAARGAVVENEA